jgi:hypothetical protein
MPHRQTPSDRWCAKLGAIEEWTGFLHSSPGAPRQEIDHGSPAPHICFCASGVNVSQVETQSARDAHGDVADRSRLEAPPKPLAPETARTSPHAQGPPQSAAITPPSSSSRSMKIGLMAPSRPSLWPDPRSTSSAKTALPGCQSARVVRQLPWPVGRAPSRQPKCRTRPRVPARTGHPAPLRPGDHHVVRAPCRRVASP